MDFLRKLLGGGPASPLERGYMFAVKCSRCGEVLPGRVDLANDLSVEYDGDSAVYFARKVLMGSGGQCFQRIEVELKFGADHRLLDRQVHGGQFVEAA